MMRNRSSSTPASAILRHDGFGFAMHTLLLEASSRAPPAASSNSLPPPPAAASSGSLPPPAAGFECAVLGPNGSSCCGGSAFVSDIDRYNQLVGCDEEEEDANKSGVDEDVELAELLALCGVVLDGDA